MKKLLALFISVVLVFSVIPTFAITASADELTENGFTYTVENGEATVTGHENPVGDLEIPATLGDCPVTSIGEDAFTACDSLASVIIPNSITSIGDWAFSDCDSLASVIIPDSVTSIGECVFIDCIGLKSITIDKDNGVYHSSGNCIIETESKTLISGCKNSVIPNDGSVTSIGSNAFLACTGLTSITIPNSVTSIGDRAFSWCKELTNITIPNSVTSIDDWAFSWCDGLTSIIIGNNVTNIGDNAFISCPIKTVYNYSDLPITAGSEDYGGVAYYADNVYNYSKPHTHTSKTTTTKATTSKNGSIVKKCSVCGEQISKTTIYRPYTFKLSTTTYTYNGYTKKPAVYVKDSAGKTISSSNYTVSYASGRKYVGTYKVTVKFKGNYSGTKYLYFKINPAKTTIKTVTRPARRYLRVYINRRSSQTTGYQVMYSRYSNFKSYKYKTVSYKTSYVNFTGLSSKKYYYVRIRTYKTVGGKRYYSGWSTAKKVKTK